MFPAIFALTAMAAPAGYLAGEVFTDQNKVDAKWLPFACAVFLPLGAICAFVCITNANMKRGEEK